MTIQASRLIAEILDSIPKGQVALVGLGEGAYVVNHHGHVLLLGTGHTIHADAQTREVRLEAVTATRTTLTAVSEADLAIILDALGDEDLGGTVPLAMLDTMRPLSDEATAQLPSYFRDDLAKDFLTRLLIAHQLR